MNPTRIHHIVSGMAGWLTYQQMQAGLDNLAETSLYPPIDKIAKGRGLEVKGEFPLPKVIKIIDGKKVIPKGSPKKIDFVMVDRENKEVFALEVKYKSENRMAGSISADAMKLERTTIDDLDGQIKTGKGGRIKKSVKGFALVRAVIVVWRSNEIVEQIKAHEDAVIKDQFAKLITALVPENTVVAKAQWKSFFLKGAATRPVGKSFGSLRSGSTITDNRFWIAAFSRTSDWKNIKDHK